MKKLLFSLGAVGFFAGSLHLSADETHSVIQREKAATVREADEAHVKSMASLLAAMWVANTCVTMPLASRFLTNQLLYTLGRDNALLALASGVGMGYLASVATEEMINFCVLKSSNQYGAKIVAQARTFLGNTGIVGLIGFLAFLASLT